MQKQRLVFLVIGIVFALAAVFMVKNYLQQQRQDMQEQAKKTISQIQENQVAVLVATKDILPNTAIEPDMLTTVIVPSQYLQPQAANSLARISGMVAVVSINKGEQITLSKLSAPSKQQAQAGRGLAEATPVGKRAITISVDNISGLAGMINPGNYVDVIAQLPVPMQGSDGKQVKQDIVVPLFQKILVIAVGQDTAVSALAPADSRYKKEEKKEPSPLITLALSPSEANLIAFIQEQGKLRLILRSPIDSQIQQIPPASWDTLFQYIMPQETAKQEKIKEVVPEEKKTYIEIYRGLNKEKIPLSSVSQR
jgi:pilus assembly protein CpaB